mmetsp:Transcript_17779/g.43099  ORF Transcript_17779/g.43099 Transcript_17779/m.43099 type:complete len:285 (+) Transcript_17779:75-929(+)
MRELSSALRALSAAAPSPADDRLKALNNELRDKAEVGAGPWLPLESNPEIFTSFARKNGLPEQWRFSDILGVDEGLLAMVARPVAAVIFLFPCTENIYAARAAEERAERAKVAAHGGLSEVAASAYHVEQVASFGNACGTIAAVHALTNVKGIVGGFDGPLAAFRMETQDKTPAERGQVLVTSRHLKGESDEAATHESAQTECPDRDGPNLDHHYCAFVPMADSAGAVHIVELDGTKFAPVDHGAVEGGHGRFLEGVAALVQRKFMQLDPSRIDFSMMGLCPAE